MNILLIGSGGREHALAWKIKQSPRCTKLWIAPGNPGMAALGELRLMEPRTSNPALFTRLGVSNPQADGSTGIGLRVTDRGGRVLASLILGHRGVRGRPGAPAQIYIRRSGDTASWLAEGALDASPDPLNWVRHEILDIKADRIATAEIHRDGGTMLVRRGKDGKFTLDAPPPGKLDDIKPIEVSQGLDALTFVDVGGDALPGTPVGSVQYATTDQQTITVFLAQEGEHVWARIAAPQAAPETVLLLANHVFELPAWRLGAMLPKAADFLKPEPKK